jgi:hypothetical protein
VVYGEDRDIHPDTFTFKLTGHRCLVLLDIIPESYGGVLLPDAYRDREVMGAGVVIMCGAEVGYGSLPYPGGVSCHPADLLGKHVVFGSNAGRPLRLDFIRDGNYIGELLVIADRDLWGPDWCGPELVDGLYPAPARDIQLPEPEPEVVVEEENHGDDIVARRKEMLGE